MKIFFNSIVVLIILAFFIKTKAFIFCDGVLCDSSNCSNCNLCNENNCKIEHNCKCPSKNIPRNLPLSNTPQFLTLSFDDIPEFESLYDITRTVLPLQKNIKIRDSLGCAIRPTIFAQSLTADFALAAYFEKLGIEVALHSVTHTTSMNTNLETWKAEISTCYNDFLKLSSIKEISGFRAPYLETNDNMYYAMTESTLLYDSSHTFYGLSWHKNESPEAQMNYWPHTLDFGFPDPETCYSGGCPEKAYPGIWEIYMIGYHKKDGSAYVIMDYDYEDSYTFIEDLKREIKKNYETNRAPLGLYFHSLFFLNNNQDKYDNDKLTMLNNVLEMIVKEFPDVVFATPKMIIDWIKDPVPLVKLRNTQPFTCPCYDNVLFENSCNDGKSLILCPADGPDTRPYYVCAQSCPNKYPSLYSNWVFSKPFLPLNKFSSTPQPCFTSDSTPTSSSKPTTTSTPIPTRTPTSTLTPTPTPTTPTNNSPTSTLLPTPTADIIIENGEKMEIERDVLSEWEGGGCYNLKLKKKDAGLQIKSYFIKLKSCEKAVSITSAWGMQKVVQISNHEYKIYGWNIDGNNIDLAGFCVQFSNSFNKDRINEFLKYGGNVFNYEPDCLKKDNCQGTCGDGSCNIDKGENEKNCFIDCGNLSC